MKTSVRKNSSVKKRKQRHRQRQKLVNVTSVLRAMKMIILVQEVFSWKRRRVKNVRDVKI